MDNHDLLIMDSHDLFASAMLILLPMSNCEYLLY